jgi:hypothetical protein
MIFSSGEIIDRSRFLGAFIEGIEHLLKSVSQEERFEEQRKGEYTASEYLEEGETAKRCASLAKRWKDCI